MKIYYILLLNAFLLTFSGLSKPDSGKLQSFSMTEGISNYGREFFLTVPPSYQDESSLDTNKVVLYIGSEHYTSVKITIPGKNNYYEAVDVHPGQMTEVSIDPSIAQPYVKKDYQPPKKNQVFKQSGIHVKSEAPVFVYVVAKNNISTEGYLAIPKSSLGRKYIISSYGDGSQEYSLVTSFPSMTGIVANYDNTVVKFMMGGDTTKVEGDDKDAPYTKKTEVLNKGDVWLISKGGSRGDLTGSVVESSLPVSVVSGNQSANIPLDNKWYDYIVEMQTPVDTWGYNYHLFNIEGRKYNPIYRIFAREDNTIIYMDGEPLDTIKKAGGVIGEGFIELRPPVEKEGCRVISSNKLINVNLYNTGSEEDGQPYPEGGPFQMKLTSVNQYQNEIIFYLPGDVMDEEFNDNYLNIIAPHNSTYPNHIEIGRQYNNDVSFKDVNYYDILKDKIYQSKVNGETYRLLTVRIQFSGIYHLRSKHSAAAYIYGFSENTAFGFPASLSLKEQVTGDIHSPLVNWEMGCNGKVTGTVKDRPANNEKRSNLALVINDFEKTENYTFSADDIIPGVTDSISWQLEVKNVRKDAVAYLTFRDRANNDTTIKIEYFAPKISITPAKNYFGSFKKGDYDLSAKNYARFVIKNNDSVNTFSIENLRLKYNDQGFEILQPVLAKKDLPPDSTHAFNVVFKPEKNKLSYDSIGVGDDCFFAYYSRVEAEVGIPVVEVTDSYFGNLTVGERDTNTVYIKNIGGTELIVEDYEQLTRQDFKIINEQQLKDTLPMKMQPDDVYPVKVLFNPKKDGTIKDSIVFITDADRIDEKALLSAIVLPPGLRATSYNWGRQRMHREEFPAGPYKIKNEDMGIVLSNSGSNIITINGINVLENINGSAFEFNKAQFSNLEIKPGDEYTFQVDFRPEKTGKHKLEFEYNDDANNNTRTNLTGIGVVPKFRTEITDFDSCVINDYKNFKTKKVRLVNQGYDEWKYADSLTIFDITHSDAVSANWQEYGEKGFKFDKADLEFPIGLSPGSSFEFTMAFVPNEEGSINAIMEALTDAVNNADIFLTGFGVEHRIIVSGGSVTTCPQTPAIINASITNKSTSSVTFAPVEFKNQYREFYITNDKFNEQFEISPNGTENIAVYFDPETVTDKEEEIKIRSVNGPEVDETAKLKGIVKFFERDIIISPFNKIGKIGEKIEVTVDLEKGDNISELGVGTFDLDIEFNPTVLKHIEDEMTLGKELNGRFKIKDKNVDNEKGKIYLTLEGLSGNLLNESGELLKLYFMVLFPNDTIDHSNIKVVLSSNADNCVNFNIHRSKIFAEPVCTEDLRRFQTEGPEYSLSRVKPNPVQNSGSAEIEFSVGLEAQTLLNIYNSNGELVKTLISGNLKPGKYEYNLNLDELPNGVYWYRLISGPFRKTENFIISR